MKYRYGSHTVYHIEYHFVWVTKYRYQVLRFGAPVPGPVPQRRLSAPGNGISSPTQSGTQFGIPYGVVSKDHVHILVSAPPTLAPSEIMWRIQGRTSSYLFEEFPHIKKRYWGRHFWARGYFCATVGQMTEEMIKEYLEHHFEPNVDDDFRMEPE